MKIKHIACILICASGFCSILLAKDYDFRKASWGMDTTAVIKNEGHPVKRDKNDRFYILGYDKKVAGLKAYTEFKFLDNKLGKGSYLFKVSHTNKNDYIYDFEKLRKILVKKYGTSKEENPEIWQNTTYKGSKDKYGLAVGMGHLSYVANWENNTTKILLKLKGENLQYKLTLTYTGKAYTRAIEKINEEKSSEGL
jgi:hypothetical protein